MINDQLEEVVSRIFQFRPPIITQGKVCLQFKCVTFSSTRNLALLGCLNCIPFLIHLSNARVAPKQGKKPNQTKQNKTKQEDQSVCLCWNKQKQRGRGEDLALGWILLKCSICEQ